VFHGFDATQAVSALVGIVSSAPDAGWLSGIKAARKRDRRKSR
jgi:hypothetical protein